MTEITDLSTTDSSNTSISGESLDGAIANMGRMDNTLQATMGMLARSLRTNVLRWFDGTDDTKKVKLDLSGLPTATERTWTAPYYSGTLGLVSDIRGQIFGLTLSNNVTDPTNDIDIAAGASVDGSGFVSMVSPTSFTKRLDAAWAVGSGNGGLMSAAPLTNTTYHVFQIYKPGDALPDFGFDVSLVSPTLPSGYVYYRRIGSIIRKSGAIVGFTQFGDYFQYKVAQSDVNVSNLGTSATLYQLTVPNNLPVRAKFRVLALNSAITSIKVSSPFETDTFDPATGDVSMLMAVAGVSFAATMEELTDVTTQIRARSSASGTTFRVSTYGYTDTRGRT